MSTISNYLKMSESQLDEEINRQNKRIANAKEIISLLKKLKIAAGAKGENPKSSKNEILGSEDPASAKMKDHKFIQSEVYESEDAASLQSADTEPSDVINIPSGGF